MKEPVDQDHYRALDVAYSATSAQIKKAYHAAAKKQHPDKVTPSKILRSTTAFQKLQAAYEILSDPTLRKAYNARYPAIKLQWDEYERYLETWQKKRQKRAKYTQEMVIIRSDNDEFKVHGHMLKGRSTFLRRELEKPGKAVITFEDEDDVVAAWVHCVYEGEVHTELSAAVLQAQEEAGIPGGIKAEFTFLAQLYVFGEKIQDDAFCNQVIQSLAETVDKRDGNNGRAFPNCKVVTAIYEGTPAGSPARQMMVHLYADNAGKHWFPDQAYQYFHAEFTYDLVREILVHKTQSPPKGLIAEQCEKWFKKR